MGGDSIIYGIGPDLSPYALYQISSASGAGTELGPIDGFPGVSAMAIAPNGMLYASGQNFLMTQEDLLTLNPATGAPTLAETLTGVPIELTANAYAFSPGGTLYAIYGNQSLFTIDTSTGAATLVGSILAGSPISNEALSFSNSGTLYLSNGTDLYTVNPSTAAVSLVTSLDFDSSFGLSAAPILMSMSFDPTDGTLYTSVVGNGSSSLGTINVTTGEVIRVGSTVSGLGPMAIEATPEPSPELLMPAGLLALAVRRRRALRSPVRI
jgi:hypothetical protein